MFIILVIIAVIAIYLIFKYKTSMSKPADKRTAVEKIVASVGVMHRKNLEEAAETVRTPEISRTEGIQKCEDALRQLQKDYNTELKNLLLTRDDLSESMSDLEAKPQQLLDKAKESKEKMQRALENGETDLAETYKRSAYRYLELKEKAVARVEKSKKFLRDIKVVIEKSEVEYDMKKATLDEMLQEFKNMRGNISTAKFNNSINIIESLRKETADKLREQNAEIEASKIIRGEESSSPIPSSKYNDEFDNL